MSAQGKKGNKGKKRSEHTGGSDKGKHDKDNQKDDSDEIDLSTIEIDPDEPTYCLCDQVCYEVDNNVLQANFRIKQILK